jgi:hypothetical protein
VVRFACEKYADNTSSLGRICAQVLSMVNAQNFSEASALLSSFYQRSLRPLEFLLSESCAG